MVSTTERDLMETNQKGWNKIAIANVNSTYYNLDSFRNGRSSLRPTEIEALGDVAGKSLLHLQCHIGLNAISWARLGARVVAVDFAAEALGIGRQLADELNVDIRFVESNIYDLPKILDDQFDLAYTDYGVLSWLPDLNEWARVAAHFLKPGGVFHIVEIHPVLGAFEEVEGALKLRSELFETGPRDIELNATVSDGYEPGPAVPTLTEYSWPWTISSVVNALIGAGLRIERLHEVPIDCRQRFESMVRVEGAEGCWRLPGDPLPLSFACSARKPG